MNIMSLLEQVLQQERFPGAVLLQGCAKDSFAFVQSFLSFAFCEQHSRCGLCDGCQVFLAENHPELLVIAPLEKGHAIKIDQIRELQAMAYQTPHWVWIQQADSMNDNSANALLKILEEPALKTHFILTVDNKNLLPKTILSRCWQFDLPKEGIEEPIAHLPLMAYQDEFLNHLKLYLNEQIDLIQILKPLEAYALDDVLCFLQYISFLMVQKYLLDKNPKDIALLVSIPLALWWTFWDNILQYRKQLRMGINLQAQLLLSRLFLILKGNV